MASTISRRSQLTERPPGLGGGINGARMAHSRLERLTAVVPSCHHRSPSCLQTKMRSDVSLSAAARWRPFSDSLLGGEMVFGKGTGVNHTAWEASGEEYE